MNRKQTIMLALSGAALMAGSQAQAQNVYNNEDLLLDFRNYTDAIASPPIASDNVSIDLGNVNTFVSSVAAMPGGTAVLDTGAGFTATVGNGFSYAGLTSVLGAPSTGNQIGFSAAAADS